MVVKSATKKKLMDLGIAENFCSHPRQRSKVGRCQGAFSPGYRSDL